VRVAYARAHPSASEERAGIGPPFAGEQLQAIVSSTAAPDDVAFHARTVGCEDRSCQRTSVGPKDLAT
jgi:hypothetical protein